MKSNVNKLLFMVWSLCMLSFAFAEDVKVKNPDHLKPSDKGIQFFIPENIILKMKKTFLPKVMKIHQFQLDFLLMINQPLQYYFSMEMLK